MTFTLIALAVYLSLLALNFATASLSYHVKWLTPVWKTIDLLNKLSSILMTPAIVVDVVRYLF